MSEKEKFIQERQADVAAGYADIKLCPDVTFGGDIESLTGAYNKFNDDARKGVFVDRYEEDLERRSVAEIIAAS